MDGIILEQGELLLLLDAVNAPDLIAIDQSLILPPDRETHQKLVLGGVEALAARGWLTKDDSTLVLNPDLVTMVGTMAYPELVIVVARDVPGDGRREFLYYLSADAIVEFTMPAEGQYRLATLPDLQALLGRILFITGVLDADEVDQAAAYSFIVEQDAFLRVWELVEQGENAQAAILLAGQDVSEAEARALLEALSNPEVYATVAMLRCQLSEVVDARNAAVLASEPSLWSFQQPTPGEPMIEARTTDQQAIAANLAALVADLFAEVAT